MTNDEFKELIQLAIAIFLFCISYFFSKFLCDILHLNFNQELPNGSLGIDITVIVFLILIFLTYKLSKCIKYMKKKRNKKDE